MSKTYEPQEPTLNQAVNEDPDYTKVIQHYKHNYPSVYDLQFLQQNMFVIPVAFSKEHKNMLAQATSHDDAFDAFRLSLIFWH